MSARANRDLLVLTAFQAVASTISVALASVTGVLGRDLARREVCHAARRELRVRCSSDQLVCRALMARLGRRGGLQIGTLSCAAGALIGAYAVARASMLLLCLGSLTLGAAAAVGQDARFAAAEVVPPERRSRALSVVLTAGIAGAFLGPESTRFTRHLTRVPFLGSTYRSPCWRCSAAHCSRRSLTRDRSGLRRHGDRRWRSPWYGGRTLAWRFRAPRQHTQ